MTRGIFVAPIVPVASSVHRSGNPVTALVPRSPTATPRKRARVPIVTASDGSPTYAMRKPLRKPHPAPTRSAISAATGMERPLS